MVDKVNFTVNQGADFRQAFEMRDEAGALLDLTGYEFKGQARDDYGGKLIFDIDFALRDQVASTGWVDMHVPADITAALKITKKEEYLYDIEMIDAASETRRVMEGKIFVLPEVTK
jgi:hypothetical protein